MKLPVPIAVVLLIAGLALGAAPPATPVTQPAPPATLPARAETAIDLALLNLERHQHADGHFQSDPKLAVTALTLTSYIACGHAPDLGRHGATVRRAIDYLVKSAPDDGYFGKVDGSRMYGQGIVVTALCEAYGLEHDAARRAAMRAVLVKALKVILDAQAVKKDPAHAGGWRYEPTSADSDLSVTAWNAIALRAARDIGLDVPASAVDGAVAYVARCHRPESHGFAYQPGAEPSIAMTAAGMISLSLLAGADRPEIASGAKFLREHPMTDATRFPYYTLYHASQAAHRAGGETWTTISRAAQERLLRTQLPSGAWPQSTSPEEPGEIYATAMAVLTLSVPNAVLPLYQR
ncbi:MAG: prenyltransferase/squalene oxidase repeat-containing protein [Tepidisphaeraceae bacterium]